MASSWTRFGSGCKSRLSAIARSCFLGRAHLRDKFNRLKQVVEESHGRSSQMEPRNYKNPPNIWENCGKSRWRFAIRNIFWRTSSRPC